MSRRKYPYKSSINWMQYISNEKGGNITSWNSLNEQKWDAFIEMGADIKETFPLTGRQIWSYYRKYSKEHLLKYIQLSML